MKETLSEHVPDSDDFDIGYIEPGKQGIRGKTRWIFDSDDIGDMYREYQSAGKLELIIWCDGRRQDRAYNKRPTAETNEPVARKKARTEEWFTIHVNDVFAFITANSPFMQENGSLVPLVCTLPTT